MLEKNNVLIFRLGSLGDLLVSLPAMIEIKKSHPESNIYLLSNSGGESLVSAKALLNNCDLIDDFIQYKSGTASQMIAIGRSLRELKFSHLYYLAPYRSKSQLIRDKIFFRILVGIKIVAGFKSQSARATTVHAMQRTMRESQRLLEIVNPHASVDSFFSEPGLAVEKPLLEKFTALFSPNPVSPHRTIISITPGSKMASKRWPVDRYITTISALLNTNSDAIIVLLGSTDEASLTKYIHDCIGDRCIDLAGKTSLEEAKAILALSQLYLGNDTGTMHLAAAVGTRCVAIFSARDVPGKWEPYGKKHIILRADVPCAGCLLDVCDRDMVCLTRISVDAVLAAVADSVEPQWGSRLKNQLAQRLN
jgi:ADP-heptose:LPS heptosyltransferase